MFALIVPSSRHHNCKSITIIIVNIIIIVIIVSMASQPAAEDLCSLVGSSSLRSKLLRRGLELQVAHSALGFVTRQIFVEA